MAGILIAFERCYKDTRFLVDPHFDLEQNEWK